MEDYKKILNSNLLPSLFIFLVVLSSTLISYSQIESKDVNPAIIENNNLNREIKLNNADDSTYGNIFDVNIHSIADPDHRNNNLSSNLIAGILTLLAAFLLFPIICVNSFKIISHKDKFKIITDTPGLNIKAEKSGLSIFMKSSGNILKLIKSKEAITLLIVSAVFALYNINSISIYSSKDELITFSKNKNFFYGVIENVKSGRYNKISVINIKKADDKEYKNSFIPVTGFFSQESKININDEIIFYSNIKKINNENDPYYSQQQMRMGIYYSVSLNEESYDIVKKSQPGIIEIIKDKISASINKMFTRETGALISAMYFGNQNVIDKNNIKNYKKAGVMHILAASGFNVGIASSIPLLVLGLIRINKKIIMVAALSVVSLYLLLTDMQVSMFRACIMFLIYSIYSSFDLDKNIFNALFIAATAIILIYPYEIYSLGFQLSFGATYGILLFYKSYRESFSYLPKLAANSLSLSLAAQIFVVPILLIQVGELNLTGILSNFIIIPMVSVIMILSIITILLSLVSMDIALIPGTITEFIYKINSYFIDLFSGINGHFFINDFQYILIIPFLMLFIPHLPLKNKSLRSLAALLGIAFAWFTLYSDNVSKEHITLLNHNNGKAMFINMNRHASLIGELPDLKGTKKIIDYIEKKPVKEISIFITNPNFINISSYSYLIKKSNVKECMISKNFNFTKNIKTFFELLDKENIRLKLIDYNNQYAGLYNMTAGIKPNENMPENDIIHLYWYYKNEINEKNFNELIPSITVDKLIF